MIDSWSRAARSTCPDCGGRDLVWMPAVDLLWHVPAADRERVAELVNLLGGDADAWLCRTCADFGIFGPTELTIPPANRRQRRAQRHRRA